MSAREIDAVVVLLLALLYVLVLLYLHRRNLRPRVRIAVPSSLQVRIPAAPRSASVNGASRVRISNPAGRPIEIRREGETVHIKVL